MDLGLSNAYHLKLVLENLPGYCHGAMDRSCDMCRSSLVDTIDDWARDTTGSFPWRQPGLDLYTLLVAEVLLQRTQATRVVPVFSELIRRCADWADILAIPLSELRSLIASLGFQNQRSTKLKLIAAAIVEHGEPQTSGELEELPGIGEYMARAIAVQLFTECVAPIDVNIARVLRRVFALPGSQDIRGDHELQNLAMDLVPASDPRSCFFAILDLGRTICTSSNPLCTSCPVATCNYRNELIRLDCQSVE